MICVHLACGSGFLASAARGAFVSGFRRDFLVIANFLRDGPRPVGAPRLALADFIAQGFFRFVRRNVRNEPRAR